MPIVTTVNDLKINRLTEAQYDAAVQAGIIGEYELSIITDLDAGQIIQVDTLPTASATEEGKIYQYIGVTDTNYTNGYFYKCVSDGAVTPTYSWTQINVQPVADPLPSQTGQSGKFLTTDGTDTSWSDKPLVNTATGTNSLSVLGTATTTNYSTNIGVSSGAGVNGTACGYNSSSGIRGVAVGYQTASGPESGIGIGFRAMSNAPRAIQLGSVKLNADTVNSDANTFKVANTNGNFEMMSADGTIPEARLADITNAQEGQVLTLDANGNAIWTSVAQAPQTMPVLTVNDWALDPNTNKMTQIVNISNVTANNNVIISPAPNSAEDYADCGILCTAQGAGTLTFTCVVTPTDLITVNVLVI